MQSIRVLIAVIACHLVFAGAASAQDGAGVRSVSAERVRPGDKIALRFLREPALSESVTVSDRGEAPFPKVGILKVSDLTIAQLQDTLRTRYSEFLRLPELDIAILRRVVVNGEVRVPGVYLVDMTTGVRDLIARAGGVTDNGNRRKVMVVRGAEQIRVPDWDTSANGFALLSGDQVLVPRKSWLVLNAFTAISTAVLVTSFIITLTR